MCIQHTAMTTAYSFESWHTVGCHSILVGGMSGGDAEIRSKFLHFKRRESVVQHGLMVVVSSLSQMEQVENSLEAIQPMKLMISPFPSYLCVLWFH